MSTEQTPWTEERFLARAEELSALVDEELTRLLTDEPAVPNLHDGMLYSLGLDVTDRRARGKRIRPVLCLLTAEALGVPLERAMAFACAIELLHNFALVHDDIEDGDDTRRGRPTTWVKYGIGHGVNIGDYLLAKVFSTVSRDSHNPPEVRAALLELLNRTQEALFAGQAMDMNARKSRDFRMAEYEALVARKTGSYLAAPMLGAAVIAGADDAVLRTLEELGHALGPLFQIKDDVIDLTSGKGRGQVGNDIREGKRSFLVAAAAERGTDAEREKLYAVLDTEREKTSDENVDSIIQIFKKTGALVEAERVCEELLKRGHDCIEALPNQLHAVLHIITEVLAKRSN